MLTGVATKFTGAAGKTVALDSSESKKSECCSPSTARTRYMNVTPSCKSDDVSVALATPVGGKIRLDGKHHGLAVLQCALDFKRDIGDRGIGLGPRQGHRMIIARYRGQILRGRRRGVVGNTRSSVAMRPGRAVRVIDAHGRRRIASRESEKQHQRNEDRRNAENEDEPVHGNQDADCCGEASGLPGCEWAAPPTRMMNSRRHMRVYPPRPRVTTSL
jgi:hypothetical protein